MTRARSRRTAFGLAALLALATFAAAEEPVASGDPAAVEFFEKQVRPIFVERCVGCHGPEKQKGDLRLDSRAAVLDGGTLGPAVEPGDPDSSLLVDAIRYGDLKMPPKSKLPPEEIEILAQWVARGAPWGVEAEPTASAGPRTGLDGSPEFSRRAEFWSFQPIRAVEPPAIEGPRADWVRSPIDRFLLAAMAGRGLEPAGEADRQTLIRRLTFDLIGLPPTPQEVSAFVADEHPGAYERLVDRLLASPQYGERWGRHWLDLVRFAETAGHEFDYDLLNAWQYRDYVVRAFNRDLPYDEFVVEQIAGDLLATPRRDPVDGSNESVRGTGFYWLGEGVHSPLDVRDEGVRRVDNQIDVLSKTFMGLTVSCARCHDHKFDPISARDYYALAGFLRGTRHQQAFLDSHIRIDPIVADLKARKESLADLLDEAAARLPVDRKDAIEALLGPGPAIPTPDGDFPPGRLAAWRASGDAFEIANEARGFRVDLREEAPRLVAAHAGSLHSGLVSDRLQGVVRSPTFTIRKPFLQVLASGSGGRFNIVIDGFEKVRDPIYGGLTRGVDAKGGPSWMGFDVRTWLGHRAYIEACDGATAEFTGATARPVDGRGWLAILAVREADEPGAPAPPPPAPATIAVDDLIRELQTGDSPLASRLAAALSEYREIESRVPDPILAPAAVDGDGEDEFVMLRGNSRTLGEAVPRRVLAVLGGAAPSPSTSGSGRLDLAYALVDVRTNPLTPRVLVNRIWKQHFGEGLVRSPDDFGVMGQAPTHPELLDWLASEFVRRGWSIKAMHRLILGSAAYRMASRATPDADRIDPTNALLHRMNVRRLEAEAVRDALLAVSGRLDRRVGGPSVAPHLSPFMEGRGRPATSGPLDGQGRRSLYLQVRRNFLNPMFQVFDAPVPFSTIGRRHASNVPAQALTLLNDPLVLELADAWAGRLLAEVGADQDDVGRIERLYREAFGRAPTVEEITRCSAYLEARKGVEPSSPRAVWADLGHALFNVKEFVYVD
ncbi:PSD1 and planctomycete cytochrome C domain-containing protein [Planctomyces sp. SH-PL62]|uniref:PSD1 and planctomycete cytochrome C domain-containing protein n=1 Tax=Planctomyces sp. SH-PL62 TaxID=1636152 RepID=UPI00078E78BB|nr:PSD1 and planctomycete cytochrome C domain-containing protein [Planctomyces sp. SH-PL62]AMV36868.1 Planctomycete cytochrome C [Planctomyces sp. SH-PL62]